MYHQFKLKLPFGLFLPFQMHFKFIQNCMEVCFISIQLIFIIYIYLFILRFQWLIIFSKQQHICIITFTLFRSRLSLWVRRCRRRSRWLMRPTSSYMYRITSWWRCWTHTSLPRLWCWSWSCKLKLISSERKFHFKTESKSCL